MVVMVRVVLPVPPDDNATLAVDEPVLPNPAFALSVLDEACRTAVPAYPPVEVTVIVEVPLLPGEGDEIVTLVAESVIPGLVTVTVALPFDEAYDESPP
jgi:hypothetical protein